MAWKSWTPSEDRFLRQHYRRRPCQEIATELSRSVKSVCGRADVLGLLKPQGRIVREEIDDPSPTEIIQRAQAIRQERTQRTDNREV